MLGRDDVFRLRMHQLTHRHGYTRPEAARFLFLAWLIQRGRSSC
jgi:hypothetical protein